MGIQLKDGGAVPGSALLGQTLNLVAVPTYTDGTQGEPTTDAEWTLTPADAGTLRSGALTLAKAVAATVTATMTNRDGTKVTSDPVTITGLEPKGVRSVQIVKPDGSAAPTGVRVSETITLAAKATYNDGTTDVVATGVMWESSTPANATVSDKGVVSGVKPGTTAVTATVGGVTSPALTITVAAIPVESIAITSTVTQGTVGTDVTITAKVLPDNATDKTITWESSAPTIAAFTKAATSATSRPLSVLAKGETTITLTAGGKKATLKFTAVNPPIGKLTVGVTPREGGQTVTATPATGTGLQRRYRIDAKAPAVEYDTVASGTGWQVLPDNGAVSGAAGQTVTVVDCTATGAKVRLAGTAVLPAPYAALRYDADKGEYSNVADYWTSRRTGKVYGVKLPKYTFSNAAEGEKTHDNAGLTAEISTNETAGRDDYATLNAFRTLDVNATVDDEGVPHVTAIKGVDDRYKADGTNGDVYVMACPGYYTTADTDTHHEILYSDTPLEGYRPLPGVLLPDGSARACLLFAKYAADLDADNKPISASGKIIDQEFGSQNRGIDYAQAKGKGYAGRCAADTFYVQLMLMLKYATRNSDVLGGCFGYSNQSKVAVAETGATRAVLKTTDAAGYLVGGLVNVGTGEDRGAAANYSAARNRTILSIEKIDDANSALNLSGEAFDTTTDCYVSTMPWATGSTDKVQGRDGRPYKANNLKQPVLLQGIELFNGVYESDADTIVNAVKDSDKAGRLELYRVWDIAQASKTSTDAYIKVGEFAAVNTATDNQWQYATDFTIAEGMILPTGTGGTSTTGMCDAVLGRPLTDQGLRQVRRFGHLWGWSSCGAFCAYLTTDLASRWWDIGGRLSALGRSKADA